MHSPEPPPLSGIIKVMPTDQSIAAIYQRMNEKHQLEKISQSGLMQSFGVTCIMQTERLMAGISYQHVLSYNLSFVCFKCSFT